MFYQRLTRGRCRMLPGSAGGRLVVGFGRPLGLEDDRYSHDQHVCRRDAVSDWL